MQTLKTYFLALKARTARIAVAATVAATGIAFLAPSGTAYATQWCAGGGVLCLNAWNGGPAVNVYSPGANNNKFNLYENGVHYNLQYAGGGTYNGRCIADYGNDSGVARAGLPTGCGGNIGWGGNFQLNACGTNGEQIFSEHWSGWLGPQTASNGQPFYLNKPTAWCFEIL
jgi:hypothetical protein